jgi:hypothetical protein
MMSMTRWVALACCLGLTACNATTAPPYVYVRASDGKPVTDQVKFLDDKTICIGESDKMAEPPASNNAFTGYDQRVSYLTRKDNVVRSCMLEKGYRLVPATLQPAVN